MCLLLDPSTTAARCTRLCIATCTISPSPGVMQPGPGQPDDDEATDHSHDDHGAPHSTAAMQARSPQPWLQTRGSPYSPGPTSWLPDTGRLRHTVADLARPGWGCRTGWQVVGTCCGQVRGQMLRCDHAGMSSAPSPIGSPAQEPDVVGRVDAAHDHGILWSWCRPPADLHGTHLP